MLDQDLLQAALVKLRHEAQRTKGILDQFTPSSPAHHEPNTRHAWSWTAENILRTLIKDNLHQTHPRGRGMAQQRRALSLELDIQKHPLYQELVEELRALGLHE